MIRPLAPSEYDRVLYIWLYANLQAHAFIQADYWRDAFDETRQMLSEAEVWVYEEEGDICGFIGLTGDYVAGLFVAEEYRGRRIGHNLLEHAKQLHRYLQLNVYEKNLRARKFYEREGFVVIERHWDNCTNEQELGMEWDYFSGIITT